MFSFLVWPFRSSGQNSPSLERLMGTPNLVVSSVNTRWQTVSTEIEREHGCLDTCRSKAATIPEEGPRNTSRESYLGVEVTPPWWLVGS